MKKIILIAVNILMTSTLMAQDELYVLSFEEVSIQAGINDAQYIDTGDPNAEHDLVNNDGQTPVNFSLTSGQPIGFSASYLPYNTPDVGLTDGDAVGITNVTSVVGAFTDGDQGYQFGDPDGTMVLTFDNFELGGAGDNAVSIDVFIQETSWEYSDGANSSGNDQIRIYAVNLDTDEERDLLNTTGSDIDDLGIEGSWQTYQIELWDGVPSRLIIEFRSNSANEAMFIDNVIVTSESTIGVDDFQAGGFKMFPNPAGGDVLNILSASDTPKEIVIYDVLGRAVLSRQISNSKLNISSLGSGIYLVMVTENGNTSTKKLVVR